MTDAESLKKLLNTLPSRTDLKYEVVERKSKKTNVHTMSLVRERFNKCSTCKNLGKVPTGTSEFVLVPGSNPEVYTKTAKMKNCWRCFGKGGSKTRSTLIKFYMDENAMLKMAGSA